jgi:hypothetical protein
MHAVFAMLAAAGESMAAFEHTDPAFTADTPALSPSEPALAFVRAPRGRFRATTRQHHPADTAIGRRPFVGRRAEAAITGCQARSGPRPKIVWCPAGFLDAWHRLVANWEVPALPPRRAASRGCR